MNRHIIDRLEKKAWQSPCRFKVGAVAFSKEGDVLGYSFNNYTQHAEYRLILQYHKNIGEIIICRVGNSGRLPIEVCWSCNKLCNKYGIRVYSLQEIL